MTATPENAPCRQDPHRPREISFGPLLLTNAVDSEKTYLRGYGTQKAFLESRVGGNHMGTRPGYRGFRGKAVRIFCGIF